MPHTRSRRLARGQDASGCPGNARLRAQAAVEMLSYAGFFFLVFVAAISIFIQVQNQELTRAENAYAQEIAYSFADSIHTAFVAGPGFVETVNLQKDVLGKPYFLMIDVSPDASAREAGAVYVDWMSSGRNMSFSAPSVTANYTIKEEPGAIYIRGEYIVIDPSKASKLNISNEGSGIRIVKG